jgi:hypothetical protein
MGYTATYPRPEETHPTAKNRVWGFFSEPNKTRPANRLQAPQPHREIDPTTTKTASGVFFYEQERGQSTFFVLFDFFRSAKNQRAGKSN